MIEATRKLERLADDDGSRFIADFTENVAILIGDRSDRRELMSHVRQLLSKAVSRTTPHGSTAWRGLYFTVQAIFEDARADDASALAYVRSFLRENLDLGNLARP
jgi:flagellar biosynthesis regulator FlbT